MHVPDANGPWFWHIAGARALTPRRAGVPNISLQEQVAGRIVSVQSLLLGINEMRTAKPLLSQQEQRS